jgi:hypothetical protein
VIEIDEVLDVGEVVADGKEERLRIKDVLR